MAVPRVAPEVTRWRTTRSAVLGFLLLIALAPASSAGVQPSGSPAPRVLDDGPVTPVDLRQIQANNSPMVAVNPSDPSRLALTARIDHPGFGCTLHLSRDGGRRWTPVDPVPNLPPGAERCYGPEIGFDRSGRLYFLFVGLQGPNNGPMGVYLASSGDGGRSFGPPKRIAGANKFQARMAIDSSPGRPTRIHVVWLSAGAEPSLGGFPPVANPIYASHSDDEGKTFAPPVQVSDVGRARVVAPALSVSPEGGVYVLYYDLGDDAVDYQGLEGPSWEDNWSLVVTGSTDRGEHFSPGSVVDDQVVPPERVMLIFTMPPPTLAAGAGGRLYAAWHDGRNSDWDVFLRRSVDGGHSWMPAQRLNDDAVGNRRHQYQPHLSLAPDGRLDALFYDRRDDPENIANQTSYTYSVDSGASFSPNLKLSELPSKSTVGARYPISSAQGLVEFGSRIALASTVDSAFAAWTDTRNSRPGEQQDIFATEVLFGAPHRQGRDHATAGGSSWLPVAVASVALLALAAGVFQYRRHRRGPADPS